MTHDESTAASQHERQFSRPFPWVMVAGGILSLLGGFQLLAETGNYDAAMGWWVAALLFTIIAAKELVQ